MRIRVLPPPPILAKNLIKRAIFRGAFGAAMLTRDFLIKYHSKVTHHFTLNFKGKNCKSLSPKNKKICRKLSRIEENSETFKIELEALNMLLWLLSFTVQFSFQLISDAT